MAPALQVSLSTKHALHTKTVVCLFAALPQVRGYRTQLRILEGASVPEQARSVLLTEWYDRAADEDLFLFIEPDLSFTGNDINAVIALGGDVGVAASLSGPNRINLIPRDEQRFCAGTDAEIMAGGSSFMLMRKPILRRIVPLLTAEHGSERLWIDDQYPAVIPFFRQRTVANVQGPGKRREWLGEEFAFCWLVRQAGGTIRGLISPTVGHVRYEVQYLKR